MPRPASGAAGAARIDATCPVCGHRGGVDEAVLRDHLTGEVFHRRRCSSCGALFIGDPPPPEAIGRYYETSSGDEMHSRPGRLFATLRDVRLKRDLAPLLSRLPAGARVADLGAGDGSLARILRAEGFAAGAVDLYPASQWPHGDIPYRQTNMAGGTLSEEDLTVDGAPAQAIVMRHVLEHLHRPFEALLAARRIGVTHALIIVPNTASVFARLLGERWYYWDPPRHLTFFTAQTLRRLAGRAGYGVPVMQSYGLDELVVSAHRAAALGGRGPRLVRVTRPTGPAAGLSSVVSAPILRSVLRAVLEAPPG